MFEVREKTSTADRALLVSIGLAKKDIPERQSLLDELTELANTLGIGVIEKLLVFSREPHAKFLCSNDKAREICQLACDLRVDCIIFDNMLSPSQQREWERLVNQLVTDNGTSIKINGTFGEETCSISIIDREKVILDIFASRARTREATLQVELARMQYSLPRMTKMWSHLDRQGGGGSGGGAGSARGEGEKQIEVDRRLARSRIEAIQRDLADIRRQRATRRKDRERQGTATAAIVGYTNAGKSSLLGAVSGADIMAKDMLFATLDTTTRKIELPDGQPLLLTDTVGFIRNLPHRLVEAFKSTLEEVVLADFLIQVVDASEPEAFRHFETTLEVLKELEALDKPMFVVLNKVDKIEETKKQEIIDQLASNMEVPIVPMSVTQGWGMEKFMEMCMEMLSHRVVQASYCIPQSRADLVAMMHREGKVLQTDYVDNNIVVQAVLPRTLETKLAQWKRS